MKRSFQWISKTPLGEIFRFVVGEGSWLSPGEVERADSLKEIE
jgi:hypothetical protein